MNPIILNDEEIEATLSLIEGVKDIPTIECIYSKVVVKDDRDPSVEIRVLLSDTIEYNELVKKDFAVRDKQAEAMAFSKLYNKVALIFKNNNNRCKIMVENSRFYVPWFTIHEEEAADEELVNGTILYDRFGTMKDIVERVEDIISKDPKLPVIENIDRIIGDGSKKSGK